MYKPNSRGTLEESGDAGLDRSGSDDYGDDDGPAGSGDQFVEDIEDDSELFEEDGGLDREQVSGGLEREPENGEDDGLGNIVDSSGDDSEGEEDDYEDDEPDVEESRFNEGEAHDQSGVMMQSIYPGSNVTVLGAYCLLMEFKRVCRLSFSTMVVLLHLLQVLCPAGNLLPTTKYQLVKFAQRFTNSHSRIDFCRYCGKELERNQRCLSSSCPRSEPNSMIIISPQRTLQQTISSRSS